MTEDGNGIAIRISNKALSKFKKSKIKDSNDMKKAKLLWKHFETLPLSEINKKIWQINWLCRNKFISLSSSKGN